MNDKRNQTFMLCVKSVICVNSIQFNSKCIYCQYNISTRIQCTITILQDKQQVQKKSNKNETVLANGARSPCGLMGPRFHTQIHHFKQNSGCEVIGAFEATVLGNLEPKAEIGNFHDKNCKNLVLFYLCSVTICPERPP